MPYTFSEVKSKYLKKWAKLDDEQEQLSQDVDAIYRTSAVGQAPMIYHEKLEKLLKVQKEKAMIWNDIRGFIIPDSNCTTLWQAALKSDKEQKLAYYDVHYFGKEEHIGFTIEDIEKLYSYGVRECVKIV